MLNSNLIGLILLLIISSCGNSSNKIKTEISEINEFEPIEATLPLKKEIADNLFFSCSGTDYLFIVNAECSICISVLIKEIAYVDKTNTSRFIIITPPGCVPLIKYYLRENVPNIFNQMVVLENQEILTHPVDELTGNFYKITDGICVAGWEYWGS